MKKQTKSKTVTVEVTPGQPLTARQKREIQALAKRPERAIDTSDIPELPPGAWKNAVRGKWYRPVKQPVSIRLDADVRHGSNPRAAAIRHASTLCSVKKCWRIFVASLCRRLY
jgi:uncharacterized protein (DUF4415 family)